MAITAYAGIDVAFARNKPLPVSLCIRDGGRLAPLPLRDRGTPRPPRGRGNPEALNPASVAAFAKETAQYLHALELHFGLRLVRVAIDAPSDPKAIGTPRRLAERALDESRISCITTPDEGEFIDIRQRAAAHLAAGGAVARMPHANQLWMLVGFALFSELRKHWECLEVFPQATVALLGVKGPHKRFTSGLVSQLAAVAEHTGWPLPPVASALTQISYGSRHDKLDAYMAAWVASLDLQERTALGCPPNDVIWVPRLPVA